MNQRRTLSLREFGAHLLGVGPDLATHEIKSLPFSTVLPKTGEAAIITATAPADLAEVLVFALGLSFLDKRKADLKALAAERRAAADYATGLTELEGGWLVQSVARKADRTPEIDSDSGLPRVQVDAAKLGALLVAGNVRRLLAGVDLAKAGVLKSISGALASRATHLVKLSVDSGASRPDVNGGFFKTAEVPLPELAEGSVTEQDYLTSVTRALTGNAANHGRDWLAFTQVRYDAEDDCLVDILSADVDLRANVLAHLADLPGAAELLDVIGSFGFGTFSGEPQLFCGDAPSASVVAPLMPVALPMELMRAKASLRAMRAVEVVAETATAEARAAAAAEAVDALKQVGAKDFPGGRPAYKTAMDSAKEALATAKVNARESGKQFLSIPIFTLMLGGSSPRNMGSGLTTAIHNAPLFTRIRERVQRASIGNKVFYATHLVATPAIRLEKLPFALSDKATTAGDRARRKQMFSRWALEALTPLMELREAWELGDEPSTAALYCEARNALVLMSETDPKRMFVQGVRLTGTAAAAAFTPLVVEVSGRVKDALHKAFKNESFGAFDAELLAAATAVVLMERA